MLVKELIAIKTIARPERRLLIRANPYNVMGGWRGVHDFLNIILPCLDVERINVLFHLRKKYGHGQVWHVLKRLCKAKSELFTLYVQHAIHKIDPGFRANEAVRHIVGQRRLVRDQAFDLRVGEQLRFFLPCKECCIRAHALAQK